ncbi:MAG TPA: GPW/gp25 family protein [Saprospiraceae bacterium]|nr:GPW/gp25 family protein [Saprospiraceae bacterium]HNG89046.1 GPW/gp25 family protein [Saprospiraceae bacterium]
MQQKSFLGTGWAFPPAFIKSEYGESGVALAAEVTDIEQSLTILLSTRPGERIMRPDYGCALDDLLFEPASVNLYTYIKDLIRKAILYYEPRVELRSVEINTEGESEGRVFIEVDMVVRTTNNRFNYVYDFYKREATIRAAT